MTNKAKSIIQIYFYLIGAIMFGDKLSVEECNFLLTELQDCHAPFQCAHGRPSIAPIVEMRKLSCDNVPQKLSFSRLNVISF